MSSRRPLTGRAPRWRRLAGAAAGAAMVTGCGSGAAHDSAAAAAERFHQLLAAADYEAACALLTERAAGDVQGHDKGVRPACAEGLARLDIPSVSGRGRAAVYGRSAMVTLGRPDVQDTVFLGRLPDGWRVVAAGCEPQGEQPYDCAFQGG